MGIPAAAGILLAIGGHRHKTSEPSQALNDACVTRAAKPPDKPRSSREPVPKGVEWQEWP
jgi:hypothetical protein